MHMMEGKMHGKWHWVCCWKPVLSVVLWLGGVASLVLAWVGLARQSLVLGLEPLAWYYNALIMGVLAMAGKQGMHCGGCGTCMPEEKEAM
jgi:hypothetical protein